MKSRSQEENDLIYSIGEVFGKSKRKSLLTEKISYFNIPDYQRGYKWNTQNISTLLDDLYNFTKANSSNKEAYYCLQNITLIEHNDNHDKKCYNVVDGQQRLTTLAIILSFLGKGIVESSELHYSIRESTHEFLEQYIYTGKIWNCAESIKPQHKDQYYIVEAAKAIQKWFSEDTEVKLSKLNVTISESEDALEKLKQCVKDSILQRTTLIVNIVDGNEHDIFSNINGAKVPLDGADLLRGILITHAANERCKQSGINGQVYELRVRMGIEIDVIARWWQNEEVRDFFMALIPSKALDKAEKAGFCYKNYNIDLLYILYFLRKEQDISLFGFRFFEYGIDRNNVTDDDTWEMYEDIMQFNNELQLWYSNNMLYHYISFLARNCNRKFCDIDVLNKGSKSDFITALKREIVKDIFETENPDAENKIIGSIKNLNYNWFEDENLLNKILILMDIICCTSSEKFHRLPFDYFRKKDEDKEHVGCQTPNDEDIKNKEKWSAYCNEIISYLEEEKKSTPADSEQLRNITEYVSMTTELKKELQLCEEVSENLRTQISIILNPFGLNSIGNLVWLDESINRGYGNATYIEKKKKIISSFYDQRFIRPHTLKVFADGDDKWTLQNIRENVIYIASQLDKWINR